jgi:surfactin synthase thioesterase subunit
MRQRYQRGPVHFVISGTAAPHLICRWQKREVLLKAMIAENSPEYLISLSRYVDNPEFIKEILPLMRRDYPLLAGYRFEDGPPLPFPITAFAARQDDFVYFDEISEWSRYSQNGFEMIDIDGDHWFLNRNRERITSKFQEIASGFGAHAY